MSIPSIGVLVEGKVLRQAIRGQRQKERVDLYRIIATRELQVPLVVFAAGGVQLRRRRVRGYVATTRGWRKRTVRLPRVIHKRALFRSPTVMKLLRRMERQGTIFVNPPDMQDKDAMYRILYAQPSLRPHLPPTQRYRWTELKRLLIDGTSVILKPRIGSVGRGVLRIDPVSRYYGLLMGRKPRVLSHERLRKLLSRHVDERNYILQHCIDLARHEGRIFDLRVPVQRGKDGAWVAPGMVAKLAVAHPFLTNLAKGGRAIPGEMALQGAFPHDEVPHIVERIQQLAFGVAETIAARYPYAADLGLDIGVDRSGHPWLFEVNTRDQRITFARAGLAEAFRTLYRNPLIYCALLNSQLGAVTQGTARRSGERFGSAVSIR